MKDRMWKCGIRRIFGGGGKFDGTALECGIGVGGLIEDHMYCRGED